MDPKDKEFHDKISLIELLLNILSGFTLVLLSIYDIPINSATFSLYIPNWTNGLNTLSYYIYNNLPKYMDDYNYFVSLLNTFYVTAVISDIGITVYAVEPDKRDIFINRLNDMINVIRSILGFIHSHYMDELDFVYPSWD
jgi:hypothetical protein